MVTRIRPEYEAAASTNRLLAELGRELRIARISSGMRQADVARRAGTSASTISRIEHARLRRLTVRRLGLHAAAVGLKPWIRLYPLGRRLLDKPQLDLLARFRARLHESWSWKTEVAIPIPGDLRSADCVIAVPGCTILVEAYTRIADWQAQTAAAARKKRDLGADHLVLLVAATHANRRAIADARPIADGSFPMRTKAALVALSAGLDPGADAIVIF